MMPGKNKIEFRFINLIIVLILLCICIEPLLFNVLSHNRVILQVFCGIFVFLLFISFAMQILNRIKREREAASHSQEKTEMQRLADKTSLRYKNLLECASDAIFVINADTGQLEEMNSRGSELFGYSREEMGKLDGKDLIPVRDQPLYTALVRRIVRHGSAGEVCITFKRKNGSRFLGEVSARLIDLGDEKVVQAIVRDVTLKKREEQDIRNRNRKLAILNSIIARANQSLHLHKVLDMALLETMELFGAEGGSIHLQEEKGLVLVAQKSLPGSFIISAGGEDPEPGHSCRMAASRQCITLLQGTAAGCAMAGYVRGSGWQSIAGIPLFAGKRLVGVMHILSRGEREYVPDDVGFLTTLGNQLGIGIEHARMFEELNWKSEELLRSHRLLEKNSFQLEVSRNRLEKNLALVEKANMELERLDIMKNHFIGMVSHEFRTPLTSILSGTEFLLANHAATGDDDLQKLLEMIHKSGARLNYIVTNLLKVVKLEADTSAVAKATLLLKDILDLVQEQLGPVLHERRQRIILQGVETTPLFRGDREYLVEIFTQLLENAVKFTPDGGEICITAQVTDRTSLSEKEAALCHFNQRFYELMGCKCYMQVEVRDSGIGIDPGEQLKIFDKFYEIGDISHHSTGRYKFLGKGTGLGLAIVKGMVEAHGGMVWVESPATDIPAGLGSSFFLLLPLEEDACQVVFPFMHAEGVHSRKPYAQASDEEIAKT
jgi:PAS domain S-box-containing protein